MLAALATFNPNYRIELLLDGINEVVVIVPGRTRNPLKYYRPHDAADFVQSGVNGDYMAPYREDYAWILDPGDATFLDVKIDPDFAQEIQEKFYLSGRGKHGRIQISNRDGRAGVKSLALEAVIASRRFGVHA